MKKAPVTEKLINQFTEFLTAGLEGLRKAAEIYVTAIDESPTAKQVFRDHFRGTLPTSIWDSLEKVGRRSLHPKLLLGGVPNSQVIRRLPYAQQEKFIDTKATVPLVTPSGRVMKARPIDLKPEQVKVVFDGSRIRDVEEQKLVVKSEKPKKKRPQYTIKGGCVYFWHNTVLTKSQLQDLLEELS